MTPTQISNMALSRLPAGAITSIDEDSVQARACKLYYQQTLNMLLEYGPWRFARKMANLTLHATNDRESRWLYRYAVPTDAALILRVWDELISINEDYLFTGTDLYCNVLTAKVEYVTQADRSANYTAMFITALVAALAVAINMPITKSRQREKDLIEQAEQALQRAMAANHNENDQTYGNHMPEALAARVGLTGLEGIHFPGPEATYPDFDPVGTFEGELD